MDKTDRRERVRAVRRPQTVRSSFLPSHIICISRSSPTSPFSPPFPSSSSSFDRPNQIALGDAGERADVADDPSEDGVGPIEVRLRTQVDEPLAGACIRPGECHAEHRLPGVAPAVDLISDRAARTTEAIAPRITILHDEAGNNAMPSVAIEKPAIHQPEEVSDRERRLGAEQLYLQHSTLIGVDENVRPG